MQNKKSSIIRTSVFFVMVLAFIVCSLTAVFTLGNRKALAENDETKVFEMVEGTSLRLSGDGGLRFRVKMNEAVKNEIDTDGVNLSIAIAPRSYFDEITDGNYSQLRDKVEISVDKSKIYSENGFYYANGVLSSVKANNRTVDMQAVAYYNSGNETVYASITDNVRGNLYDVTNQAALVETYSQKIFSSSAYNWYGEEGYPIVIKTVTQYNVIAGVINNGTDLSGKTIEMANSINNSADKIEIADQAKKPQMILKYIVKFMVDGQEYTSTLVKSGETLTLPEAPKKNKTQQYSYKFVKWVDENGEEVSLDGINDDVTLNAVFDAVTNKYVVTWKDENGSAIKTENLEYGSAINAAIAPTTGKRSM